jgi:acetylornithine deacetylase/succinyl-diaminopimelate desuccinylase-like protein
MTPDVARICSDLITLDTSNYGDGTGPGEASAAEYVEAFLRGAGLDPERFSTTGATRQVVVCRVPGEDPQAEALVVHLHLDVVPAIAADWSVPAFEGTIHDGMVWGRGAVDMKDMDAMVLTVVQHWQRQGIKPRRDIVLLFLPDEEAGGRHGAHWVVDHRPDVLHGVTQGIGEVGGFSYQLDEHRRLYMIETAQKGLAWLRLQATGTAGHGSLLSEDNAITRLSRTIARIGAHQFPVQMTPTVERLLADVCEAAGIPFDASDPQAALEQLGPLARMIGATLRHTANPTMLDAGYKSNVIPGEAHATVDARFLPGLREDFYAQFEALLEPGVTYEAEIEDVSVETEFGGSLVEGMTAALLAEDPGAIPVPYTLSGGTDAKSLSRLGITCYGFAPLRLPPDLDFSALFHGVDERVPIDALEFGVRVLDRFLRTA